ncbi:hypothetical protein PGTUg99_002963 [Puccinia graminis f. sp. tritici]|uniref:Uncharacterized protein n=1 Tax=Puccinia graminis f. sp. tritici TaxID=56615 RepID=A0A5B0QKC0_PUCGR|nr:hypothetical protein PGTUg99_002963 [Puccinia graminis f. sp. tritici]
MMVVESTGGPDGLVGANRLAADNTDYDIGILFPTSDSEVEIIRPIPRAPKRQIGDTEINSLSKEPAKKKRPSDRRPALFQTTPLIAQAVTVNCFDSLCRKQFCTCPTIAESTELAMNASGDVIGTEEDQLRFKSKCETSGQSALKQMVEVMKKIQNRSEFAKNCSPMTMEEYMQSVYSILKMVDVTSQGVHLTPAPQVLSALEAGRMNGQETEKLLMDLQTAGWGYLKRVNSLVTEDKHRHSFCLRSSSWSLDLYKNRCWRSLDTVLDNCPSLKVKRQIR